MPIADSSISIHDWPGAVAYSVMCICMAFAAWAIFSGNPLIVINRKKD